MKEFDIEKILNGMKNFLKPNNFKFNLDPFDKPVNEEDKIVESNKLVKDQFYEFHDDIDYQYDAVLRFTEDEEITNSNKEFYKILSEEMDKVDSSFWEQGCFVEIPMSYNNFDIYVKCVHYDNFSKNRAEGYYQFFFTIMTNSGNKTNMKYRFKTTFNKMIWNIGELYFSKNNNPGKKYEDFTIKDINNEYNKFAECFQN